MDYEKIFLGLYDLIFWPIILPRILLQYILLNYLPKKIIPQDEFCEVYDNLSDKPVQDIYNTENSNKLIKKLFGNDNKSVENFIDSEDFSVNLNSTEVLNTSENIIDSMSSSKIIDPRISKRGQFRIK